MCQLYERYFFLHLMQTAENAKKKKTQLGDIVNII